MEEVLADCFRLLSLRLATMAHLILRNHLDLLKIIEFAE